MKNSPERTRRGLLGALIAFLVGGAFHVRADPVKPPGLCPLCQAEGIAVPDRDQLTHCECEKWWNGHAPARLVFADCSKRICAQRGPDEENPLVYVDLHLYRCPNDGLLFTDPK